MARRTDLYHVGGERVVSVTEALGLAGVVDFSRVDPEVLEVARQRGQLLHQWLEMLTLGFITPADEPDPAVAPMVAAYLRFLEESRFEPAEGGTEQVVVNPAYRYAGTIDLRGRLNGRPAIIDYKGVARVGAATALQLAGYALALPEPHMRFALHLRRDGSHRLIPYTDRQDAHDFLACVRVASWKLRAGLARLEE